MINFARAFKNVFTGKINQIHIMTKTVKKFINDNAFARWTALVLVALMMFFAYMFVDVLSPLQTLLEQNYGWSAETYGTFCSSEYFLNVFVFFLIFAGIILDKMGVRFTGILAASVMIIGAAIKLYAVSSWFSPESGLYQFLNSFWISFPPTAKLASLGFMIFGCGVEMAGVTVSKAIVRWFKGKELALAMGIEMAIARLGVAVVFRLSPYLSTYMNEAMPTVVIPVLVVTILLIIGLLSFTIFSLMDLKLEKQKGKEEEEQEEAFKVSDLGKLFTSKPFLIIAGLCVLYYSAIFPFQKFATGMLETNLGMPTSEAAAIFSWFPIGAMILTPFLGFYLDKVGKGASMLILGALLMISCHLVFALVPLTKPLAYAAIILLGISFSLVPAALWPSVPKIVEERYLGSAYSVIFWIQNIGLMAFPIIIGWSLDRTGGYTVPMLIFSSLGVFALLLGLWLKAEDKKYDYGLERPNIQKQ